MKIIRALRIYAFVKDEVFSILLRNQGVKAVRTAQSSCFRKTAFIWRKSGVADFAENLPFASVVFVKVRFRCIAARTFTVVTDIAFGTSVNSFDGLAVTPFDVFDEIFVIPNLVVENFRQFIYFEFLVLWRMRIVECPLLKRDISANKI